MPLIYWHEQLRRTRCPGKKPRIALVLQAVEEAFERHSCTRQLKPEVLVGWKAWAAEHAKAFQRASSAVEGRNGYLSQMSTTIAAYPASFPGVDGVAQLRLLGRRRDDTGVAVFQAVVSHLFESVLSQIDELPMPRQRRQALVASH